MKIRKTMVLAMAILAMAACKPPNGSSGGNGSKPDKPAGPAAGQLLGREYRVQLNGMNDAREPIRRRVRCTIEAKNAQGQVVYITDGRSGDSAPMVKTVHVNSQNRLRLQVWANVHTIAVECTMTGEPGESLSCEFLDSRGGHAALEARHVEFSMVEEGDTEAICLGLILVTA